MNKGFILIDSLLSVFIVTYICIICVSIYKVIENYNISYVDYQNNSNQVYEYIFDNLPICEPCILDESD